MPDPARSLALSVPESGVGRAMGLLNLSLKADCAHALGALCTFGRGFNGDTRELDWLWLAPQKASRDDPARVPGWEGRESVSV